MKITFIRIISLYFDFLPPKPPSQLTILCPKVTDTREKGKKTKRSFDGRQNEWKGFVWRWDVSGFLFLFFCFFPFKKKIKKIVCNHTAKYVVTDRVWSLGCHNSYHILDGLDNRNLFSHFWRSEIKTYARKFSFW